MKIQVIRSVNPFYESSASANRWLTLLEGFSRCGAEIQVIVVGGFFSWDELASRRMSGRHGNITYCYSGLIWGRLLSFFSRKAAFNPLYSLAVRYNTTFCRRKIQEFRPDIVMFGYERLTMDLYLDVCVNRSFYTMLEASEFDDIGSFRPIPGNRLQEQVLKKMYEKVLPDIDIFNLMTPPLVERYRHVSGGNGFYLHTPMTVDMTRFQSPAESGGHLNSPYVMYCGTISAVKDGVDILIKAFIQFHKHHPEYSLYLAGCLDSSADKLLVLVGQSDCSGQIHFLGARNRDEIPGLLKQAAILALARPPSHQADGGFPTKLGEYLATGNPVCVTRTGGIPDYLRDEENAFLADPGSIESFYDALMRAAADPVRAKEIGKNGRETAEKSFSMTLVIPNLYMTLKQYLESHKKISEH